MDGISALGIAGNVVQFIEFSYSLLSDARALYRSASGQNEEHIELGEISKSLTTLSESLGTYPEVQQQTQTPRGEIQKAATSCKQIAVELSVVLEKLKVDNNGHRKWKSFVHALRSHLQSDKIQSMKERLEFMRDNLSIHIISQIRYDALYLPIYHLFFLD